jgi:hypothetical protein
LIEEYTLGTESAAYDILYLRNQKLQYVFNMITKECQKVSVDMPWTPIGISKNATFLGESYMGSSAVPNASVLVTLWEEKSKGSVTSE